MHAHHAIAHARTHADARNGDEEEEEKKEQLEGRKEDVGGQDGRRNGAAAVQSSTGKSVGPPQRRPSPLLIPTAVLRLYLAASFVLLPVFSLPFLAPPRPSFPLSRPRAADASFSFSPVCLSRFSRLCFSLFLSPRFCRALAVSVPPTMIPLVRSPIRSPSFGRSP